MLHKNKLLDILRKDLFLQKLLVQNFSSVKFNCNLLVNHWWILETGVTTVIIGSGQICKIFERKIPIIFNIYFGCTKEPSHQEGSFEYPQQMFWLRNKKNNFDLCTL